METKKKLRCPLGVPGGIIAALIVFRYCLQFNAYRSALCRHGFAVSLALFLLAGPLFALP